MNRRYNQYCGVARALDVVGERWTLLIVRDLVLGPLRYSELLRGLPGITTNLLAKRLKELEERGIIERIRGASSESHSYRLTPLGASLEPAVQALARWGRVATESVPARGERRRFEWLLFALRDCYRGGQSVRAELIADDVPYRLVLSEHRADIGRGDVASADLRIRGSAADLARMLLQKAGALRIPAGVELQGSRAQVERIVDAFDHDLLRFAGAAVARL